MTRLLVQSSSHLLEKPTMQLSLRTKSTHYISAAKTTKPQSWSKWTRQAPQSGSENRKLRLLCDHRPLSWICLRCRLAAPKNSCKQQTQPTSTRTSAWTRTRSSAASCQPLKWLIWKRQSFWKQLMTPNRSSIRNSNVANLLKSPKIALNKKFKFHQLSNEKFKMFYNHQRNQLMMSK